MTKYFVICGTLLVKGETVSENSGLVCNSFAYRNNCWESISSNEINDRLIGYDPSEEPGFQTGNDDIMEEITEISEDEAKKLFCL